MSWKVFRFLTSINICQRFDTYKVALVTVQRNKKRNFNKLVYVAPATMGLWIFQSANEKDKDKDNNNNNNNNNNNDVKEITAKEGFIVTTDVLYEQGLYEQLYDHLSNYKHNGDVEILWRLSRVLYKLSKTADESEAKKMILEAYDYIQTAISIKEDHYAVQKWMAILLDSKSSLEGMKSRIQQLYTIKKHMLRAIELNPKDATILYMLGTWCYHVSDLAWYQRKIASLVFGEPPNSSFEEALTYFEKAEEMSPNFYSLNLLMLAKTYLKLGRKEDALKYLKLTTEYPTTDHGDVQSKKEAQEILNAL
ncbi:PREDICTED: regulator of microtubule dynamics protein 1-like [Polistes canadensis]|uniref:regulator of microtubule dynamics protein 1-like n=1 Tax=Polistes canadensis TaxID=91411 RepID=UPI000718E09D|nr:PREDICTED: regulator of microtubule dynamics protein 1-like [Polistes canadensis]